MGASFKHNPGDIKNNCQLISRDYKDANNNWYGTFECLLCHNIFQTRIKRVFNENRVACGCRTNADNLKGQVKGLYTIIERAPNRANDRNAYWKCRCECGAEFEISSSDFNRHEHIICPHNSDLNLNKKGNGGRPVEVNLLDQVIGKLTVKRYLGDRYWECKCDCGNITKKRTDTLLLRSGIACPKCLNNISSGELTLMQLFEELKYDYVYQQTFDSCRFPNTNRLARFDFYLPSFNILIEYNGEQHYNSKRQYMQKFGDFEQNQYRDKYKKEWCESHSQPLIIIPYNFKLNKESLQKLINTLLESKKNILEIQP